MNKLLKTLSLIVGVVLQVTILSVSLQGVQPYSLKLLSAFNCYTAGCANYPTPGGADTTNFQAWGPTSNTIWTSSGGWPSTMSVTYEGNTINGTVLSSMNDYDGFGCGGNIGIMKLTNLNFTTPSLTRMDKVNCMTDFGNTHSSALWGNVCTDGGATSDCTWKSQGGPISIHGVVYMPVQRQSVNAPLFSSWDVTIMASPDGAKHWTHPGHRWQVSEVACSTGTVTLTTTDNVFDTDGGEQVWLWNIGNGIGDNVVTSTAATSTTVAYSTGTGDCSGITAGAASGGTAALLSANGDEPADPSSALYEDSVLWPNPSTSTPNNRMGRVAFLHMCQDEDCDIDNSGTYQYVYSANSNFGNVILLRVEKDSNLQVVSNYEYYYCPTYYTNTPCDGTLDASWTTNINNATVLINPIWSSASLTTHLISRRNPYSIIYVPGFGYVYTGGNYYYYAPKPWGPFSTQQYLLPYVSKSDFSFPAPLRFTWEQTSSNPLTGTLAWQADDREKYPKDCTTGCTEVDGLMAFWKTTISPGVVPEGNLRIHSGLERVGNTGLCFSDLAPGCLPGDAKVAMDFWDLRYSEYQTLKVYALNPFSTASFGIPCNGALTKCGVNDSGSDGFWTNNTSSFWQSQPINLGSAMYFVDPGNPATEKDFPVDLTGNKDWTIAVLVGVSTVGGTSSPNIKNQFFWRTSTFTDGMMAHYSYSDLGCPVQSIGLSLNYNGNTIAFCGTTAQITTAWPDVYLVTWTHKGGGALTISDAAGSPASLKAYVGSTRQTLSTIVGNISNFTSINLNAPKLRLINRFDASISPNYSQYHGGLFAWQRYMTDGQVKEKIYNNLKTAYANAGRVATTNFK